MVEPNNNPKRRQYGSAVSTAWCHTVEAELEKQEDGEQVDPALVSGASRYAKAHRHDKRLMGRLRSLIGKLRSFSKKLAGAIKDADKATNLGGRPSNVEVEKRQEKVLRYLVEGMKPREMISQFPAGTTMETIYKDIHIIKDRCREISSHVAQGTSPEEIASTLGYSVESMGDYIDLIERGNWEF